jgi:hypothetical protein
VWCGCGGLIHSLACVWAWAYVYVYVHQFATPRAPKQPTPTRPQGKKRPSLSHTHIFLM